MICLVIILAIRVMVIKMSKMAHILYFLLMTANKMSYFGQIIYTHLKDLNDFFQKIVRLILVTVIIREISRIEISIKKC